MQPGAHPPSPQSTGTHERAHVQPQPGSQWLLAVPISRLVVGLGGPLCPPGVMLPTPDAGKGCKKLLRVLCRRTGGDSVTVSAPAVRQGIWMWHLGIERERSLTARCPCREAPEKGLCVGRYWDKHHPEIGEDGKQVVYLGFGMCFAFVGKGREYSAEEGSEHWSRPGNFCGHKGMKS